MPESRPLAAPAEESPGHAEASGRETLRKRLLIAFVIVLTVGLVVLLPRPLNSDISGQLWIAHHLRKGARLYIDISEINPPLWFWLAMPIDWIAETMAVPSESVLVAAVGVTALLALLALDPLIDSIAEPRRHAFLAYAAVLLLIMPLQDFGQREQLVLICALPYAALAAIRRQGRRVSWRLALLVGAGSAVGFLLKHYFLVVPVFLEIWLMLTLRRKWPPLRPETISLTAAGVAYVASILIVTPTYLSVTVPELRLAYGAVGAPSVSDTFTLVQIIWAVTALAIASQHRALRGQRAPLTVSLLIGAIGFTVAWAIQHKGWPYQGMPVTGFLALSFAALLAEAWSRVTAPVRMLALTILLLPIALCLIRTHPTISKEMDIAPALADLRSGDSIAVVSTEGATAWPSTVNREFRFSSRFGQYWMFPAIAANAAGAHDPRIDRFAAEVIRETVIDYRCLPPKRIIFIRPLISVRKASPVDDPLAFFLQSADFAQLLGHYRHWQKGGIYDAYQLVTPLPPLPRQYCRRGV